MNWTTLPFWGGICSARLGYRTIRNFSSGCDLSTAASNSVAFSPPVESFINNSLSLLNKQISICSSVLGSVLYTLTTSQWLSFLYILSTVLSEICNLADLKCWYTTRMVNFIAKYRYFRIILYYPLTVVPMLRSSIPIKTWTSTYLLSLIGKLSPLFYKILNNFNGRQSMFTTKLQASGC